MSQQQQSNVKIEDVMNDLKKLVKSEGIVKFKLIDGAKKILLKMVSEFGQDSEKFLTLAEIRRNFRSLNTQDAEFIVLELRDLDLLEVKIRGKSMLVFRYNYLKIKQANLLGLDRQERLKSFIKVRNEKRIKFYEQRLANLRKDRFVGDEQASEELLHEIDVKLLTKSVLELHEAKECDPLGCRLCAAEQNKEFGL